MKRFNRIAFRFLSLLSLAFCPFFTGESKAADLKDKCAFFQNLTKNPGQQGLLGTDLALEVEVSQKEPKRGDTVRVVVRLLNEGKTSVTNVVVQASFSPGLKVVNFWSSAGRFDRESARWSISKLDASATEARLRFDVAVDNEGPLAIQAEVKSLAELDNDSKPGNAKMGEDDLAFGYVTVPIVFCGDEPIKLVAEAFPGFTGYQWLRDGKIMPGENSRSLNIKEIGRYTCQVNETKNSDAASFPVLVRQVPGVQAKLDDTHEVCAGETLKLRVQPSGGTPPFSYSWKNNLGLDLNKSLKAGTELDLIVTVTDKMGCKAKIATHVTVVDCKKE